jgi:hypothetical protein
MRSPKRGTAESLCDAGDKSLWVGERLWVTNHNRPVLTNDRFLADEIPELDALRIFASCAQAYAAGAADERAHAAAAAAAAESTPDDSDERSHL